MEVLLNLAWILLVLPACWLWRRSAASRQRRGVSSLQCLLALASILVLLFPVISASDDLHAMRAEMEDSSISKRAVRQAGSDRHSASRVQGHPALMTATPVLPAPEVRVFELSHFAELPIARPLVSRSCRAPPSLLT